MPRNAGWKVDEEEVRGGVRAPAAGAVRGGPAAGLAAPSSSAGSAGAPVGSFTNFGTWFGLNKEKAGQMAGTMAGNVQKQGEAVKSQLAGTQGKFDAGVSANTLGFTAPPSTSTEAKNPIGTQRSPGLESTSTRGAAPVDRREAMVPGAITSTEMTQRAAAAAPKTPQGVAPPAPGSVYAQPQTAADAAKLGSATYQGPKSLSQDAGWADMLRAGQKAETQANLTGTEEGRQTLVQQTYGGAPGTYGSALDAGLANVAGANDYKQLRDQYGSMGKLFSSADAASRTAAGQAAARTADSAAAYRNWSQQDADAQAAAAKKNAPTTIGAAPGVGTADDTVGYTPGANPQDSGTDSFTPEKAAEYGLSVTEAQAAIDGMTSAEYAQWVRGRNEGDGEKYLGKGWFAKHKKEG